MIKYLACVLLVAAAVSAYDFGDPDFNEYLFDDLRADYEDAADALARSRRDAPVPGDRKACGRREGKKDFCCKSDHHDAEPSEEYREAKKQCQAEFRKDAEELFDPFNCEKMQQVKQQAVCVSECVGKKLSFVDASGELIREPILAEIRRKVGANEARLAAVEAIVDRCMALVQEKKAAGPVAEGCDHGPLEFHHCIWREFAASCPAEMRVDSPRCNKIRERLDKGDSSVLNKFFLHQFHHVRHED